MSVHDKLRTNNPRKLLALDGGGARGVLSIEILARIEAILRGALQNPTLTLSDYFDYIAGTSTGAIIATMLSWGMETAQVRAFYTSSGDEMFQPARLWHRYRSKFESDALTRRLKEIFGAETTLGTDRLRTLLMLVLRNATTDSAWPVSNNPQARFNDRSSAECNLHLPLWQLIRASTAAPTYFPPEVVSCGQQTFVFVDGAVTMYNNPAFQLFKMAALEPYRLCWPTGRDKMLLVSVGTGFADSANASLRPEQMNMLYHAASIPAALLNAALHEQDLLCRMFGDCRGAEPAEIDAEIGSLARVRNGEASLMPALFTYVRYNAELSDKGIAALGLAGIDPQQVQRLDTTDHLADLQTIGRAVGEQKVRGSHFEGFLAH